MRPLLLLLSALIMTALNAAEPFSLAKLTAAAKDVQTLRVTFTQVKHLAILNEPVTSPGLIEISRTLRAVRWEYTGKSVLLFKGGHLRRFGAEGKEETVTVREQGVSSVIKQMEAFIDGNWAGMDELFTITPAADGSPQLDFAPKTPDLAKYITSLRIRWRADLSAPEVMELVAAGNDRTEYRFDVPQVGLDLPAARFEKP